MDRQRPKSEAAVNNDVSGEAMHVVQAETIRGGVHIGSQSNRDIGLVLEYERDEVHTAVGSENKALFVEISNRRPGDRRLVLHADGVPSKMWEIVPNTVTVSPDHPARAEIRLRCASNEPAAGSYELRVCAEDTESSHGASWLSNIKKVIVPPNLVLARSITPDARISTSGTYRVKIALTNDGNTELKGSLRIDKAFRNDARYLDSNQITVHDHMFELGRGDTENHLVTITFVSQPFRDQRWRIPLAIDCERTVRIVPSEPPLITQHGWLSDFSLQTLQAGRRLRSTLQRISAWGGKLEHRRRGVLAGWIGTGLLLGTALGVLVGPSPRDSSATADAGTQPTSSPVSTSATPIADSGLTCQAGMSVVVLASLKRSDATHAAYLVARENGRITRLKPPPKQNYSVKLSTREVCARSWSPMLHKSSPCSFG